MKKRNDTIQYALVILVFALLIGGALWFTLDEPRYDLIWAQWPRLLSSFFSTIAISFITLAGSLIVGFVLFVMLRAQIILPRAVARVFSEIMMGTPLLVMIFLVVYPFGQLFGSGNKLFLGVIAMILYNSPYIANAYESTAAVVGVDQYTVMDLYHFKWYQRYRYVIVPQMVRPFIPSLVNNLSSVIKGSALLNVISVGELTYMTTVISNRSYAVIEGYYVMWISYLLITIPLSLLAQWLGKKLGNEVAA